MAILLALLASVAFSFASTLFADFSKKISAKWINCFKLSVGFVCFSSAALVVRGEVSHSTLPYYILSGAIGLFLADHFLCTAFSKLGSSRTLLIFSFSPLFVAAWSFVFWGEKLSLQKFVAILFFMLCVYTLALEKFKKDGRWELLAFVLGVFGILMDALANVITSYGFKLAPSDSVMTVCALRGLGAFAMFLLIGPFIKVNFVSNFRALNPRNRSIAIGASVLGTFLSIVLWVSAVKRGNLTTLAAVGGANPLFAAFFEISMGKTQTSRHLALAFFFFICGFCLLIF
jgi:DME family drug/metabolite transporter